MAEPTVHHVYCDESQTTAARFMVYGGIITGGRNVAWFDSVMAKWREDHNMQAELKWSKTSNQKLAEYRSLVDLFFEHATANRLHFKSIVFDTTEIDYETYHGGDKDLGFYKFYYQFLLHKFGPYAQADDHRLYVFLDQRDTKYKLKVLCSVLNAGIRKKYKRNADVVKQVEARDSKKSNLLQVADVIMGAIGWHNNDLQNRPNARKAKIELADYIAAKAKLKSLKKRTAWGRREFEIWRFRFTSPKKWRPDASALSGYPCGLPRHHRGFRRPVALLHYLTGRATRQSKGRRLVRMSG